jgi:uncharacterized protein (UPF0254 family)
MPKTSYAEKISDAEVMVSGLTKNLARLSRRGVDEPFIQSIATLKQEVVGLNNEQESLKAQLKKKTEELDKKLAEMMAKMIEARKLVKLEIDFALWKECGITDQK